MFEYLFKYPQALYRQAEWFFASGWSVALLLVAIAAAALMIALSLGKRSISFPRRFVLWVLQTTGVAVLLLMLWQPAIRSKVLSPGENSLVVLVDTSRSMAYRHREQSRIDATLEAFESTGVLDDIGQDFEVELLSVADGIEPLQLDALPVPGDRSELRQALLDTLESAAARVLSGVVIVSDGADTSSASPSWWQRLAAYQVPVYAVGVGRETLQEDLAISNVSINSATTPDTPVNARVSIRYGEGGPVRLRVLDGDALLFADTIDLPAGGNEFSQLVQFDSGDTGLRDLRFEIESRDGEKNLANNTQRRILSVEDQKRRILYVEGEPRWEYKFIRRAVNDSPEVDLVTLLHTSPNKFYRQGVRDADELKDGFPDTPAALFEYDAIIIGSLEAAMLSDEQQQSLREFVRTRGGSLLMLAGASGLANGGWARSVVAQALPVAMSDTSDSYTRERVQADITTLGLQTDWLKFAVDESDNRELWRDMPLLADVQPPGAIKPGASVLLEASLGEERLPLLAWQRYGRGKSYVLATSGTWRWQMGLPATDLRHEKFWQGLLGDLSSGVLPRLAVSASQPVYMDDTLVDIDIDVRDQNFEPDTSAQLDVRLSGPDAPGENIPVVADPDVPGRFKARLDVQQVGEFAVTVANRNKEDPLSQTQWFLRQDKLVEDHALALNQTFLSRLATETGGSYLPLSALDQLPDRVRQSQAVLVRDEILPVWNVPAAFLLLLGLKLLEWALRWRWNRL